MEYFTTRKLFLFPPYSIDVKEREKLDKFLKFLDDSKVATIFPKRDIDMSLKGGRPSYSYYDMLATVLYSFAFTSGTLRTIESSCKYDLRFMYLMNYDTPNYSKFGQFINEVIVPNRKEIFKLITNQIIKECGITIDDVFIDGSKFEADANK